MTDVEISGVEGAMLTKFKTAASESRYRDATVGKSGCQGAAGYPTPGEVFREIGTSLAAALAVALLANLLAAALGA